MVDDKLVEEDGERAESKHTGYIVMLVCTVVDIVLFSCMSCIIPADNSCLSTRGERMKKEREEQEERIERKSFDLSPVLQCRMFSVK